MKQTITEPEAKQGNKGFSTGKTLVLHLNHKLKTENDYANCKMRCSDYMVMVWSLARLGMDCKWSVTHLSISKEMSQNFCMISSELKAA